MLLEDLFAHIGFAALSAVVGAVVVDVPFFFYFRREATPTAATRKQTPERKLTAGPSMLARTSGKHILDMSETFT